MTREYLIKRGIQTLAVIFVVVTINFVLPRLLPGDPAARFYEDPRVSPEVKEEILRQFGLDKPIWQQYLIYLRNLLGGEFGISYTYRRPVMEVILSRIPWTVILTGSSFVLSVAFGVILGAAAAWRRGSALEAVVLGASVIFAALPSFWFALLLLLVFAFYIPIFPAFGMADPILIPGPNWAYILSVLHHAALPVFLMSLTGLVGYAAVVRYSMIDVTGEQYIVVARAKGVPERTLLYKHALRNALLPLVTRLGLSLAGIIGGAVIIETIFSWEGMGLLVVEASRARDYPLMQGTFLILASVTILSNLAADLLYAKLDPRVELR